MPRRETPFIPDEYYHLYNRGNNRQAIFFESANYLYFLRGVKKYVRPEAAIIAYCLMPTHYHMLVRVKTSEVSETSEVSARVSHAMQNFLISYTKAINKRYSRVGALFQRQFQAKPVKNYEHLLNLCIYIHANPVKDGLVADPEDWIYSNYLEWLGKRDGTLVDRAFISEHFGAPAEYQSLVMEYLKNRRLPDEVQKYLQALES
jgi:REP element-mobilizing transposase RayT